jgi:pyridine nucleotide-disulfide oxidoreductase family protein
MKTLLLVGGGHAHVHVIERWQRDPIPAVQLVVVAAEAAAPYSGMVPGWLAGRYRFDEITIDVAALTQRAGGRWVAQDAAGLDAAKQQLLLADGNTLAYDVASINIGSTLHPPAQLASTAAALLSMRPLSQLQARWKALLAQRAVPTSRAARARRVVVAGGGPAGIEALLAVLKGLAVGPLSHALEGVVLTRDTRLLTHHAPNVRRYMQRALAQANVTVHTETDAATYPYNDTDIVLWATGAQAHAWPSRSGLEVDGAGFIQVNAQLQSVSHPQVFAAGDCCAFVPPQPKAGVTAVRMGPDLGANLWAALGAGQATPHQPRSRQLALLATADGRAVASWGPWTAQGAWVWRLKDRIDRRFVARFNGSG